MFVVSATLETEKLTRSNTLSITRLLKKLEAAIAKGDHAEAAVLAKDLATLKVSCSVTQQQEDVENEEETFKQNVKSPPSTSGSSVGPSSNIRGEPANGDGGPNVQIIKELPSSIHHSEQLEEDRQNVVVRREHSKSLTNRREIKSDNVSRLLEQAAIETELPVIMENFK